MSLLAVQLGVRLRVLGADMFIKDATGAPVPPALGTGPWLDDSQHALVRQNGTGGIRTIRVGGAARLVYLSPIVTPEGEVIGTVEASLPLGGIEDQLDALRRWLTLIIAIASALAVVLSFAVSGCIAPTSERSGAHRGTGTPGRPADPRQAPCGSRDWPISGNFE